MIDKPALLASVGDIFARLDDGVPPTTDEGGWWKGYHAGLQNMADQVLVLLEREILEPPALKPDEADCRECWNGMQQIQTGDWVDCHACRGAGVQPLAQLGIDDFPGFCPDPR